MKQYDIDYQGGSNSLYNKRFGSEMVIPREESAIVKSFENVKGRLSLKANDDNSAIRMFDFGCGSGRTFPIIAKIAQNNRDRKIELIAYDPSIVGLQEFIKMIELQGFKSESIQESLNHNNAYVVGKWCLENLSVTIVTATASEDLSNVKLLVKDKIHVIFSIFTPLGHVPARKNRQAIIFNLGDMLDDNGEMILNVSTRVSLPNEALAYEIIRNQYEVAISHNQHEVANALKSALRIAMEPGDFYYSKYDKKTATHNYGHVYSKGEIIEDVEIAGLKIKDDKVMSIKQPYQLTNSKLEKYTDSFLSSVLSWPVPIYPFKNYDQIAKNIYVVAIKNL